MANELEGQKIAILAADGVEQVELEQPREAVEQSGAETELLSVHSGVIQAMNSDMPAFCSKIVEEFAEGRHQVRDEGATAGAAA